MHHAAIASHLLIEPIQRCYREVEWHSGSRTTILRGNREMIRRSRVHRDIKGGCADRAAGAVRDREGETVCRRYAGIMIVGKQIIVNVCLRESGTGGKARPTLLQHTVRRWRAYRKGQLCRSVIVVDTQHAAGYRVSS